MKTLQVSALLLLSLNSAQLQAQLYLHTNLKCVSTVERREIHIYQNLNTTPEDLACKVDYMKYGEIDTLWVAQSNTDFCVAKARELTDILESANFKCVSTATFEPQ